MLRIRLDKANRFAGVSRALTPLPTPMALDAKREAETIKNILGDDARVEIVEHVWKGCPMLNASTHAPPPGFLDAPVRLLLVEDDAAISGMLTEFLREGGFDVQASTCAQDMDRLLLREEFDLVVLDVLLPGEDGLSICRRLRASASVPIIMLTALAEEVDRIVGLEIGADDYVTKPFNPRELVARIRAVLRRTRMSGGAPNRHGSRSFRFAGWRVFPAERQVYNPEGVRVATTSAEFDILLAFCRNPGRVLSRDQLLDLTHGGLAGPVERSVDVHVSRIRQKIESDPREPSHIKTVRLGGYIFTPLVESL
jgi:two-component system OmpR family response regulator